MTGRSPDYESERELLEDAVAAIASNAEAFLHPGQGAIVLGFYKASDGLQRPATWLAVPEDLSRPECIAFLTEFLMVIQGGEDTDTGEPIPETREM